MIAIAALISLSAADALAHATVMPKQAVQDSYQRLAIGITHGCEGSATTTVIVNLPESLMGAKPMPKPGWTIQLDIRDLDQPYLSHGKEIRRDVRRIVWQGGQLPDNFYDEFVIQLRVSNRLEKVHLPVTQLCEVGRIDWNQVPDGSGSSLPSPAPVLEIVPGTHLNH